MTRSPLCFIDRRTSLPTACQSDTIDPASSDDHVLSMRGTDTIRIAPSNKDLPVRAGEVRIVFFIA